MEGTASASVIMVDVLIYFIVTIVVLGVLDLYAAKKLGGKERLGYKALRIPKFFCLMIASGISVVIGTLCWAKGLTVTAKAETFLGIPYLVIWFYYMTTVLRRIRAEKSRYGGSPPPIKRRRFH